MDFGQYIANMGMPQPMKHLFNTLYAQSRMREAEVSQLKNELGGMRAMMERMSIERSRTPDVYRIEDIPGRRIPWVVVFDIPIDANVTSVQPVSQPISQEGPFVCLRRWGVFQSAYEFQTTDSQGNVARINGRSYGRYRPIHSVCDINDSQHSTDAAYWYYQSLLNAAAPGDPLPSGTLALPSNASGFRTMEFDGRIGLQVAGSTMPRQNEPIPSAFWTSEQNGPVTLGALDFFTQGEVITARVSPLHANNPAAGNVAGDAVLPNVQGGGPVAGWPFGAGQFDVHEGIATPGASTLGGADPNLPTLLATDSVERLPVGILTLALEGYRIIQVAGAI